MPARLIPLGAENAAAVTLQRPVLLVGRHPECDIRLDVPQVSRRHCCLAQAYDRLTVRDLGSRNGVRVNGRLVEEALLQPGDEVAIAQVLFRLEIPEPPRPQPPAAPRPQPASLDDLDLDLIPLDD